MEDVELRELVRRFQTLQKEEVPSYITERNAVEIVNALVQRQLIDLLFTTDAKEYLTWEELKREMVDEVHANGGRLNVIDLPGLLSVHMFQVERVLPSVLEENPTILLEGGELMTDGYLDSLALAAADLLKEHGSLAIPHFASKHQLSSLFVEKILHKAMQQGRLEAVLHNMYLYTKSFVRLQCMVVRAGLLAAEVPVRLDAFYKRHDLFLLLLHTVVDTVKDELPGSFEGYDVYIPAIYEARRTAEVDNVYASNGYVDYGALQRQNIRNPRQYMADHYNPPDAVAAAGAVGTDSTTTTASSSASPSQRKNRKRGQHGKSQAASSEPVRTVVRASPTHPLCGYQLASGFVSDRFLSAIPTFHSFVEGESMTVDVTENLPPFMEMEKDWPLLEERLRELYPGLERATLVANTALVSEVAEEKVKSALLTALQQAKKSKSSKDTIVADTIAAVLKLSRDRYNDVIHELMDMWADTINALEQQLDRSTAQSAAATLKQTRAALQDELTTRWSRLCIVAKGAQWAQTQLDEQTGATLLRHALSTHAYELTRLVIRNESLDNPELSERVLAALDEVKQPAQLPKALLPFSEQRRESLKPMIDALQGKSLDAFLEQLREMSGTGVVAVASFHALNKKAERETYANMKAEVVREASAATASHTDAIANGRLLAVLCSLLVHVRFRCHLEITGKAVGGTVRRLLSEDGIPVTLEMAKEAVSVALQQGTADEAGAAVLEQLRQATLAMME